MQRSSSCCDSYTLLLSQTQTNHERARDLVASLLTRGRGEYIFRIGTHPAHSKLFAGESISATDGQSGSTRTIEESDIIKKDITIVLDEIGGTVCRMSIAPSLVLRR